MEKESEKIRKRILGMIELLEKRLSRNKKEESDSTDKNNKRPEDK